jgi:hypothetical protein
MPSKWSLKPIPYKKWTFWLVSRSVLVLVAPWILQGVTKAMRPLLYGLLACAVLIATALWPLAEVAATWITNRHYRGSRKSSSTTTARVELERQQELRKCVWNTNRWFAFGVICAVVGACFHSVVAIVIDDHFSDEREDVLNHLLVTTAIPYGNISGSMFTVRNGSNIEIGSHSIDCGIREAVSSHLVLNRNTVKSSRLFNGPLKSGNDGESYACVKGLLPDPVCFDVFVNIHYTLADQPKTPQSKEFRLVAMTVTGLNWISQPVSNEASYCTQFEPPQLKNDPTLKELLK